MADRKVVASEFAELKAKVKAEMLRRNGYGSLTGYAGDAFNYTVEAVSNNPLMLEHMTKNHQPLSGISFANIPTNINPLIKEAEMVALEAKVAAAELQPRDARVNNDCSALCSGVCVTQCTITCTSCTGCSDVCTSCLGCSGCGGACSHDCTSCTSCSGCGDSCSYNCSSGCTNNCKGCGPCTPCSGCRGCNNCTGGCGAGCANWCSAASYTSGAGGGSSGGSGGGSGGSGLLG